MENAPGAGLLTGLGAPRPGVHRDAAASACLPALVLLSVLPFAKKMRGLGSPLYCVIPPARL